MHVVEIMGIDQLYFAPGESVPDKITLDDIEWGVYPNIDLLPPTLFDQESMRTVIVRHYPHFQGTGTAYIQHLYWLTQKNLIALDEKIQMSQADERDFEDAIYTHYHPRLICIDGCKSTWSALIAETGGANLARPGGKHSKKLDQLERVGCPDCGKLFRIMVVKILDRSL